MNSLKSTLKILCNNKQISGALVITKDGMIIESDLGDKFDGETIGAFMSLVAVTIKNSLNSMGHEDFTRYVMQSDNGQIYLVDMGKSFLISLTERDIDTGEINIALFQAANGIKKMGRFDV